MKKYTLPPEWHKQQALLLTFPDEHTIWKDTLADIEPLYVEFARTVLHYQDVIIICRNQAKQQYIEKLMGNSHPYQLRFFQTEFNDLWIRDYGPISLIQDGKIKWLDFGFNAWGGKYAGDLDDKVTRQLYDAGLLKIDEYSRQDFILEGGAIETDGLGTLLVTPCVLTKTRNAHLSLEQIQQSLNMDRVIMIEHGYLLGDDTDGHVDTLVRFCDPHTLAYSSCDNPNDAHYDSLKAMEAQIKELRDLSGNPYKLIPLPIPSPKLDIDGRRLPASYANFLIINNAVLCPTYDDPFDTLILERLKTAFPDRKVIAIPSLALIQYNGALHCASMQIPATQ
ncbi:MAG: agmatine deiminase family protein [Gammaproteobacteria bacterium]|jgi:agmatine/peptidylarginine deiminase